MSACIRRWGATRRPHPVPAARLDGRFRLLPVRGRRTAARLEHRRPDWRGFGPSQWLHRPYYFAEHMGDMEAILDHYAPDGQVRLVGHSMGGILSCLYAGIRPERVEHLVTLDGFGIARPRRTWPPNATGNG